MRWIVFMFDAGRLAIEKRLAIRKRLDIEDFGIEWIELRRSRIASFRLAIAAIAIASGIGCWMCGPAAAADYATEISAFRRTHGLAPVKTDSALNAVALYQAQAMAASGTVSHTVGGSFSVRVAKLRKKLAAENIAAGFLTFPETLKQWEDSAGHRENLLIPGAQKIGVASVANPKSPYRMFWAMVITD